jgi:membrane-bound inhibitor of C-type lysozyme
MTVYLGVPAVLALGLVAGCAQQTLHQRVDYICATGGTVSANYLNLGDGGDAMVQWQGLLMGMHTVPSGSGARYDTGPGKGHVWWTKGNEGTLYTRDAAGAEIAVATGCQATPPLPME